MSSDAEQLSCRSGPGAFEAYWSEVVDVGRIEASCFAEGPECLAQWAPADGAPPPGPTSLPARSDAPSAAKDNSTQVKTPASGDFVYSNVYFFSIFDYTGSICLRSVSMKIY